MMKTILATVVLVVLAMGLSANLSGLYKKEQQPNILWLTTEDIGPELPCYGDAHATTPVLDDLSARGVRYDNAFASAPVCAPARSCIITGIYAPSLGSHHMRSTGWFPDEFKYYPQYLAEAGYYCTNNSKTDYNLEYNARDIWDESSSRAHWRNRPEKNQPFFAVFNFTGTHESRVNDKQRHEENIREVPEHLLIRPDEVKIPPYFPATAEVKELWARYYNNITAMDFWIKNLLDQLEEDGLTENTIIFFYGDHGAGVPRHKRWLYDSGLRVPMIVYAPEKYRHLVPAAHGSSTDELVSFVDLAPTVLNLAGVEVPEQMQGRAFLGKNLSPQRDYVYAARDRMDERYDMQRAVRDKHYKYIRYYDPAKPFTQYMNTPEKGAIMVSIRESHANGTLTEHGEKLMLPNKPIEELFDTEKDPWELNNLAGDPAYREILERMRTVHAEWSAEIYDAGLIPETILRRWERQHDLPIYHILRTKDVPMAAIQQAALSTDQAVLDEGMSHPNEAVRYWSAYNLGNDPDHTGYRKSLPGLQDLLEDDVPVVRLAAARAILKMSDSEKALNITENDLRNEDEWVRLYAALVLDELDEKSRPAIDGLQGVMQDENKYVVRVANRALNQLLGTSNVVR